MQELPCFPEKITQLAKILQDRQSWRQISSLSTYFWHIRRLYIDYILTILLRNTYLSIHIKHAGAWLPTLINDVNLEQFTHQVIHCASVDTQGLPVLIWVRIPPGALNYFS